MTKKLCASFNRRGKYFLRADRSTEPGPNTSAAPVLNGSSRDCERIVPAANGALIIFGR
ncbi:MAG: hypothetical protein FWF13_05300 [Acidobacteria bacterium]|nr:hypothetical protein [Acidobacteriota bacterium]